jgi:hypothetical protein
MSEVKVVWKDADPETIEAEELIIEKKNYILNSFNNDKVIIPRSGVRKLEFDSDFVEVVRED